MRSGSAPLLLACLLASMLWACSPDVEQPTAGTTATSEKDGARLRYVPAGSFVMGSEDGWAALRPAHDVTLAAFWIDETEVTNCTYALCVEAGSCPPPQEPSSYTREAYFGDPKYEEYPVVRVAWKDAKAYCEWAGRRLPTEAEWEKAARGADGRLYPWGDEPPTARLLNNFDVSFLEDTVQAGSYPDGASPYGALDMVGNVWEWTADWFGPYPGGDPAGSPNYGDNYRVLRGGSFVDAADVTTRYANDPELHNYDIGIRCAVTTARVRD